jgi:hypothetical protein
VAGVSWNVKEKKDKKGQKEKRGRLHRVLSHGTSTVERNFGV